MKAFLFYFYLEIEIILSVKDLILINHILGNYFFEKKCL